MTCLMVFTKLLSSCVFSTVSSYHLVGPCGGPSNTWFSSTMSLPQWHKSLLPSTAGWACGKSCVEWKESQAVSRKVVVIRAGRWKRRNFCSLPRGSSWVLSDFLTYSACFKTWPAVIHYLSMVFKGLELIVELTVLTSNLLLGTILLTLACHSLSVILTLPMGWTPQDRGADSFGFVLHFSFLKYSGER